VLLNISASVLSSVNLIAFGFGVGDGETLATCRACGRHPTCATPATCHHGDAQRADLVEVTDLNTRSTPLDGLTITVVVDNETDNLSSIDAGIPQLPEVVSLLRRIPPTRRHDGHDCIPVFDHLCVACHGLSVLLTGLVGNERHTVLFDVGPYGDVWVDNAERLGIDISTIEKVFLSHWHWDHSGGLPVVIDAIAKARRTAGLDGTVMVDLHPDRPDQRGIRTPSGTVVMLPEEPTLAALADAGGTIELHDEPHLLGEGFFLGSGAIARTTSYEVGLEGHHTFRGDLGEPDPLIMDERFLAAEVRGRGVTVLSACSHAGIVNACLGARSHYPELDIDLVLGGFHLAGALMEQRIDATATDLFEVVRPHIVAPGHCTGWRAKAALADRFAPGRYAPSVVGTSFFLTAPAD
jgi:7,8-dihydropterin-6-yl-methyl-4-(beta-D-ribofuranosyl)aminobenzene 5'-phosphate synthase